VYATVDNVSGDAPTIAKILRDCDISTLTRVDIMLSYDDLAPSKQLLLPWTLNQTERDAES
jgi:hypothetical protein